MVAFSSPGDFVLYLLLPAWADPDVVVGIINWAEFRKTPALE
jgi:hypothetical protein